MAQPLLILLIIVGYFLLMAGVSHIVSRKADNSTFFSGNRKMPWPLVAMAMICAPISGVTFISVPGMVVTKGYGYLQMCLGFIVGYMVIATVLLPVFYRNNVVSVYSYLGKRFGEGAHRTGAWMFLISKVLGTAVRLFIICAVLQVLVFEPVGISFPVTVILTLTLVWFYTVKGGVKTVIWTDMLKCVCLIGTVVFCIICLIKNLGLNMSDIAGLFGEHHTAHIFNFNQPREESYFWKQFIAGVFMVVAMTGLDQDMMQHALSCRDARSSAKNMITSSVMQFVVIALFLFLGTLLVVYSENVGLQLPEKSDSLFATVAFHDDLPLAFGILFVLGMVAATYSSAGSALTSLTTSYTLDICHADRRFEGSRLATQRKIIHAVIAAIMALIIVVFYYVSHQDAISAVFTLASYTYGPILGLFAFGLFTKRKVNSHLIPILCLVAPILCLFMSWGYKHFFDYDIGFELLIINAAFTIIGLYIVSVFTPQEICDTTTSQLPKRL